MSAPANAAASRGLQPSLVYRSAAPEVLASHEKRQRTYREFYDMVGAFNVCLGRAEYATTYVFTTPWVMRLASLGGDRPGPLWRADPKGGWVPSRRTAAGKVVDAQFRSVAVRFEAIPGMPNEVIDGGYWRTPGFRLMGGELWAAWWGDASEAVEGDGSFDPSIWTRCKLSEYHAAVEDEELAR